MTCTSTEPFHDYNCEVCIAANADSDELPNEEFRLSADSLLEEGRIGFETYWHVLAIEEDLEVEAERADANDEAATYFADVLATIATLPREDAIVGPYLASQALVTFYPPEVEV